MGTVLEIGGGTTPYFIRYGIPWREGDAYICLDVNEKRLQDARQTIQRMGAEGGTCPARIEYLVQDAVTLPFETSSVHAIVLSNVLSAPIHQQWNEQGTMVRLPNSTGPFQRPILGRPEDGDLFYRERKPLVQEALRVLKPGGILTIYTDLLVYGQHSYERILEELRQDMSLQSGRDTAEERRIDQHNREKLRKGDMCYCFDAEVLPNCSVFRFTKIY